jgi:hypothetical protein
MDELYLRISIKILEMSISSLEPLLTMWEEFVVLGLVVEFVALSRDWWHERYDFLRGTIHTPEHPGYSKLFWGLLGTALIAVGVGEEVSLHIRSQKMEVEMRDTSNALVRKVTKEAGDAKKSADKAVDDANRAHEEAKGAHQEADAARKDAGKASGQLAQLRTDTHNLEAEASKTKSDLIDFAVCNSPRVIRPWEIGHGGRISWGASLPTKDGKLGKSYVDPLTPMAGQTVFIEYVPDAEARRAALSIAITLHDAKWNVQKPLKTVDWLEDGVSVQPSAPLPSPPNGQIPNPSAYEQAADAADKLLDFLHSYNWQARIGFPTDAQGKPIRDPKILPAGAIRVQVGLYPATIYVSPPGQEEFKARSDEYNREWERAKAELKRKREMQLSKLSPEVRKREEQGMKEWEAETKNIMTSGPCQILNWPF